MKTPVPWGNVRSSSVRKRTPSPTPSKFYGRYALDEISVTVIPFWKVRLLTLVKPRPQIMAIMPFMRHLARAGETGDTAFADPTPGTMLDEWARSRRGVSAPPSPGP